MTDTELGTPSLEDHHQCKKKFSFKFETNGAIGFLLHFWAHTFHVISDGNGTKFSVLKNGDNSSRTPKNCFLSTVFIKSCLDSNQ